MEKYFLRSDYEHLRKTISDFEQLEENLGNLVTVTCLKLGYNRSNEQIVREGHLIEVDRFDKIKINCCLNGNDEERKLPIVNEMLFNFAGPYTVIMSITDMDGKIIFENSIIKEAFDGVPGLYISEKGMDYYRHKLFGDIIHVFDEEYLADHNCNSHHPDGMEALKLYEAKFRALDDVRNGCYSANIYPETPEFEVSSDEKYVKRRGTKGIYLKSA